MNSGRAQALRYASVCSGIEAASVAWLPLGWQCVFLAVNDEQRDVQRRKRGTQIPIAE